MGLGKRRYKLTTATRSFHLLDVFYPGARIEAIHRERNGGQTPALRTAIAQIIRRHKMHPAARRLVLRLTGYDYGCRWTLKSQHLKNASLELRTKP